MEIKNLLKPKISNYVIRKIFDLKSINMTWTSQMEEYVKLGLFILYQGFSTLQEFNTWLNARINEIYSSKDSTSKENQSFEITQPTLSRYLSGKISISKDRGLIFYKFLNLELETKKILMDKIREFSKDNWASINTRVILTDIVLLNFIVIRKILESDGLNDIDAIITPEADGIPLGVMLAQQLKRKCIYVRKNKRSEEVNFVQVEVQRFRNVVNYYLSLKELPPDSKVLLVDDIKRTGSTLSHLEELISKAGSKVVKKMVLINIIGEKDIVKDVDSFLELVSE